MLWFHRKEQIKILSHEYIFAVWSNETIEIVRRIIYWAYLEILLEISY